MSGMGWDDNIKKIIMDDAEYRDYIKVHVIFYIVVLVD